MKQEALSKKEMGQIATVLVKYVVKKNLPETVEFWKSLSDNQKQQELGNSAKFTGIPVDELTIYGAITLREHAPEIFGEPTGTLTEQRIGEISLKVLSNAIERSGGIKILPRSQEQRRLGNIARTTGITRKKLNVFCRDFYKREIERIFGNK